MSRSKVKITVLKRVDPSVIFNEVPHIPGTDNRFEACPAFEEGQEFVVEIDGNKPEGFCVWAWNDLFKSIAVLHFGGDFPWTEEGETIACCTDGIRPVSFRLERID